MKEFWTRVVSVCAIVLLLVSYNTVLQAREKDEEIAELTAQIANGGSSGDSSDEAAGNYKDGTYTGEAQGFGGPISMEVIVESGVITEVNILSADNEDGAYLEMAKDIIPTILEEQTWDVDTISGATFSSTGIKEAVEQALEEAVE